jgi:hypothetical protein
MPTRINLHEAGLRRSPRLETKNKNPKAHVPFGAKSRSKMLGLFTLISLVSSISLPSHQAGQNKTSTERLIRKFKELNEHYDTTINEMHLFSFLTDVSSNEVFTFQQAMKETDRLDFVTVMEKEIEDHESCGHWSIIERSSLPHKATPNQGNFVLQTQTKTSWYAGYTQRSTLCTWRHSKMGRQLLGNILPCCQYAQSKTPHINCKNIPP